MLNEDTQYGFQWGSAEVERMMSDEKQGWVYMGVKSPRFHVYLYVTKTGKIRVYKAKRKGNVEGQAKELK